MKKKKIKRGDVVRVILGDLKFICQENCTKISFAFCIVTITTFITLIHYYLDFHFDDINLCFF